jgi:hypothetical protein
MWMGGSVRWGFESLNPKSETRIPSSTLRLRPEGNKIRMTKSETGGLSSGDGTEWNRTVIPFGTRFAQAARY